MAGKVKTNPQMLQSIKANYTALRGFRLAVLTMYEVLVAMLRQQDLESISSADAHHDERQLFELNQVRLRLRLRVCVCATPPPTLFPFRVPSFPC